MGSCLPLFFSKKQNKTKQNKTKTKTNTKQKQKQKTKTTQSKKIDVFPIVFILILGFWLGVLQNTSIKRINWRWCSGLDWLKAIQNCFKEVVHQNLACFVLYLKIINTIFENDTCISQQIGQGTQNGIKI